MKDYYFYMMTNWTNERIYAGVTNNLERRVNEHRSGLIEGFTKKYKIKKLVYFEHYSDIETAILREKEVKAWRREKKDRLVEIQNPEWNELLCG